MQATMTFEHRDIQAAMATIKEALHTCQKWARDDCDEMSGSDYRVPFRMINNNHARDPLTLI